MTKKVLTLSCIAAFGFAATLAQATTYVYSGLTTPTAIDLGAQGFGNTFTVLTVQASTSPESGCIGTTGSALTEGSGACGGEKTLNGAGTLVIGGDEANPLGNPKQAAPSLSALGITSANQIGVIWNGGSPGDANVDITDVSVKLYDANGNL